MTRLSNVVQLWCGVCDIQVPTLAKLEDHHNSRRHENRLRKFNVFPPKNVEEFLIYYVSKPSSEVVQQGKSKFIKDTRFWCKLCSSPSNDIKSFQDHNFGSRHKARLLELHLHLDHEDFEYYEEFIKIPYYTSEYNVSRPVNYELPQAGFEIIDSFRALGVSIRLSVRKVLKVERQCVFTEEEQLCYDKSQAIPSLRQISHSVVLIDNGTIIGILVFDEIPSSDCKHIEKISRGIYATGGHVERSSTKGSARMVMCGWRRNLGKRAESIEAFGRYSHAIRGQARKRKVQGEELEEMGDFIVGDLLATHLERLFPSFLRELTKLLTESGSSLFLGTIGGTSITTLAITSNYFAQPHLDLQDLGYAFLIWFVKDWPRVGHVRSGGQFILPEYGLFILPEDGTILALSTSTVHHCTHVATSYDVIGMSLSAKKMLYNKL